MFSAVLDPQISYEGMKADYSNDPVLCDYLEESKTNLIVYYKENYAAEEALTPTPITPSSSQQRLSGSPQKSFTSCYRNKSKASVNELEEYLKLPIEDFETCNPIQWWMGCWAQFPKLFKLACDILCIPGAYSNSCYC